MLLTHESNRTRVFFYPYEATREDWSPSTAFALWYLPRALWDLPLSMAFAAHRRSCANSRPQRHGATPWQVGQLLPRKRRIRGKRLPRQRVEELSELLEPKRFGQPVHHSRQRIACGFGSDATLIAAGNHDNGNVPGRTTRHAKTAHLATAVHHDIQDQDVHFFDVKTFDRAFHRPCAVHGVSHALQILLEYLAKQLVVFH